jgi:hypothetical protein
MALKLVNDTSIQVFDNQDPNAFPGYVQELLNILGINSASDNKFIRSLPFSLNDVTAGVENELQTAVIGKKEEVDLPMTIENSRYYRNLVRRAESGDMPRSTVSKLEKHLNNNPGDIWENSWVRFPASAIGQYSTSVFARDLLSDKNNSGSPKRCDANKFVFSEKKERFFRIPISYLLKLALAESVGMDSDLHPAIKRTAEKVMEHFLNDNTSPETFSFYPAHLKFKQEKGVVDETLKRFLLTQCLIIFANKKFRLIENGQKAVVYFAPHPHTRQKHLNDLISDSFYRELFMSPCLSGWDKGEVKHGYMNLCHMVLSRSQLNAVAKLREAGIISRNLVVLPNMSNISLANNGTHISLGSRKLTQLLGNRNSGFGANHEKYIGDLAIKIIEHFLPLFVGTYSAAPYRMDYRYFHPETALGFLPHELDFTHLRMLWRRWKKKARLAIFGITVTPFGPEWLDCQMSRLMGLNGDFVNDFRLIDYPVSLLSSAESPGLDGMPGNDKRLKKDLADMGIFDTAMPMYLLYRLREHAAKGFSGFEGRYYSLFENFTQDMRHAVSLQALVTALAFKYILKGEIAHFHIPDQSFIESERRQVFFGSAIGIPTFFIHKDTKNLLMAKILKKTKRIRPSNRYKGYLRVYNIEYRRALIEILKEDAADLIEMMGVDETLRDLVERTENPAFSTAGKLTRAILLQTGASSPMKLSGDEFNLAAEQYYRDILRKRHICEAFGTLEEDLKKLEGYAILDRYECKTALSSILKERNASEFFESVKIGILDETIPVYELKTMIRIILLSVYTDMKIFEARNEQ